MEIIPLKTPRIEANDSLVEVFLGALKRCRLGLRDGDIILVVSKVVALTEGRLVKIDRGAGATHVGGSARSSARSKIKRYGTYRDSEDFVNMVRREADIFFEDEMFLSVKNGIFAPSAGIDTSNIPDGYALGWPVDSYASSEHLRTELLEHTRLKKLGIKHLGIEIFDSFILPLREGVTGISLGYSGFHGVEDCRGKKDLYGKKLRVTRRNIADGLAAAATLVCGEAGESIPFVIIRGADADWSRAKISPSEIRRAAADCLYRALYPRNVLRDA